MKNPTINLDTEMGTGNALKHPKFNFLILKQSGNPKFAEELISLGDVQNFKIERPTFRSNYRYPVQSLQSYKNYGSLDRYKGAHYIDNLPFKFKNLVNARDFVQAVLKIYSISSVSLQYYFSGHKNFDVLLPVGLFGHEIQPADNLSEIVMEFACSIEEIDFPEIYDRDYLMRVPNTKNQTSGCYKIQLNFREFSTLSFSQIQTLSKKPRPQFRASKITPKAELIHVLKTVKHDVQNGITY